MSGLAVGSGRVASFPCSLSLHSASVQPLHSMRKAMPVLGAQRTAGQEQASQAWQAHEIVLIFPAGPGAHTAGRRGVQGAFDAQALLAVAVLPSR
jgi:hypothetical protein